MPPAGVAESQPHAASLHDDGDTAASGLRTLGVPLTPFGRPRFPAGLGASSGMVMVFLDFYDESNRDSIF